MYYTFWLTYVYYNLYYHNFYISKLFLDGVLTQYPVPKILTSNIVDTNGAGDAFIGGKIAFLIKLNYILLNLYHFSL